MTVLIALAVIVAVCVLSGRPTSAGRQPARKRRPVLPTAGEVWLASLFNRPQDRQ